MSVLPNSEGVFDSESGRNRLMCCHQGQSYQRKYIIVYLCVYMCVVYCVRYVCVVCFVLCIVCVCCVRAHV